ncbi:MAG: hypothetical protein QM627_05895 [Luteolibacter sp.]
MVAFRIFRNGSEICLAGVEGLGVLTAIVTWANRNGEFTDSGQPEQSLDLTVGGLHTATQENLAWLTQRLSVGETITIHIEDSDVAMNPTERYIYPEEFKIDAMKQNARDLAKKLGWQLIETNNQAEHADADNRRSVGT